VIVAPLVERVTVTPLTAIIPAGQTQTLTAAVLPGNAANKDVTWSSSHPDIASVSNGTVTALNPGQAMISATTVDGAKTAACALTVTIAAYPNPVAGVTLDAAALTLLLGESHTLTATVAPENASNKDVTWSTSNFAAVAITNSGALKAVSLGQATITATTVDGEKTAVCVVTVNPVPVMGIGLKPEAMLGVNFSQIFQPTFEPANATNKNVSWTSNNTDVATVNDAGLVRALSAGTATITVISQEGAFEASCELSVINTYVTGRDEDTRFPSVWINNQPQILATEDQQTRHVFGSATSVKVTDNGDVYVFGWDDDSLGYVRRPLVWKNGALHQILSIDDGRSVSGNEGSLFVSGDDIYVASYDGPGHDFDGFIPRLWKNGELQPLEILGDEGRAFSVAVSGNDVYTAGEYYEYGFGFNAVIWKNGEAAKFNETEPGTARSVFVSGNDVYAAGYQQDGNSAHPVVWENGVMRRLPHPAGMSVGIAYSVFVSGQNVYAAGYCNDSDGNPIACYWKNGVVHALGYGEIFSVFVLDDNVFMGGYMYVEDEDYPGYYDRVGGMWINDAAFRVLTPQVTSIFVTK